MDNLQPVLFRKDCPFVFPTTTTPRGDPLHGFQHEVLLPAPRARTSAFELSIAHNYILTILFHLEKRVTELADVKRLCYRIRTTLCEAVFIDTFIDETLCGMII